MALTGFSMRSLLLFLVVDVVIVADCTPLVMRREDNAGQAKIAVDGAVRSHAIVSTRGSLAMVSDGVAASEDEAEPAAEKTVEIKENPTKRVSTKWDFELKLISNDENNGLCVKADLNDNVHLATCCNKKASCDDQDKKMETWVADNIDKLAEEGQTAKPDEVLSRHNNQVMCSEYDGDSPKTIKLMNLDACNAEKEKLKFKKVGDHCFEIEANVPEQKGVSSTRTCLGVSADEQTLVFGTCKTDDESSPLETKFASDASYDTCHISDTKPQEPLTVVIKGNGYEDEKFEEMKQAKKAVKKALAGFPHDKTKSEDEAEWKKEEKKHEIEKLRKLIADARALSWHNWKGKNFVLKGETNQCLRLNNDGQNLDMASCNARDKRQQWVCTPPEGSSNSDVEKCGKLFNKHNGKMLCFDGSAAVQAAADNCPPEYSAVKMRRVHAHCFQMVVHSTTEQDKLANRALSPENAKQPKDRCISYPKASGTTPDKLVTTVDECDSNRIESQWVHYGDPDQDDPDPEHLPSCFQVESKMPKFLKMIKEMAERFHGR